MERADRSRLSTDACWRFALVERPILSHDAETTVAATGKMTAVLKMRIRTLSRLTVGIIACLCILTAHQHVVGQESATYTPEELHKHFQNVADAYQMKTDGVLLSLRKQPLMHWQNTVRLQEQGALYMWERNGRPQVLGSILRFRIQLVLAVVMR